MTSSSKMNNHLTIIVPTYSRCDDLRVPLNRLAYEIGELGNQVQMIIGDNASCDSAKLIVQEFILIQDEVNLNYSDTFKFL